MEKEKKQQQLQEVRDNRGLFSYIWMVYGDELVSCLLGSTRPAEGDRDNIIIKILLTGSHLPAPSRGLVEGTSSRSRHVSSFLYNRSCKLLTTRLTYEEEHSWETLEGYYSRKVKVPKGCY